MLIDTHAHLTWEDFQKDLPEVVRRSKEAGVGVVINVGADLKSSQEALKLTKDKSLNSQVALYSTIGLHPEEGTNLLSRNESIQPYIDELEIVYQTNPTKVVAVGECGLDFFFGSKFAPAPLSPEVKIFQKELFLAQINLAKQLNLPLIIHCRDSWEEIFLPELQETTGVFHSFTGTEQEAKKILNLGYYLGFTCVVTYPKNDQLRQVIAQTPLDKILTETDCPYLPPQTQRGQRNEPANISEVIRIISEVKNLPNDQVAQQILLNATKLFGI